MDINEGDVSLGIAKNYSIQRRVIDSSGAGANAESIWGDLALAACDPLSELVYLPHEGGLSLKCASSRAADKKPFLVWNVGPNTKVWGSRDRTAAEADDMLIDRAMLLGPLENHHHTADNRGDCDGSESNGKMEEAANQEDLCCPNNLQIAETTKDTADLQPQKVSDDEATSAAGASNNNVKNIPFSNLAPLLKSSPPFEISETNSRISVYMEKGKGKENASSNGDDEDDIRASVKSCSSAGLLSRGIKRWGNVNDMMYGSKRTRNQISLRSGSTFIRPDGSFMNWMSKMAKDFSASNRQDSSSFDVNAQNLHRNFIDVQASASLNIWSQTIVQPLYCEDMNILSTGEEKENDCTEESKQLMMDDKKTPDDLCSSKKVILCDNHAKDGVVIPAKSFGEQMNYAAEKTSLEKRKLSGSSWVTRLCTKSHRLEQCHEIFQETIGSSCPKLDLESGINVVLPIDQKSWENRDDSQVNQKCSSTKSEVSVDIKSTSKVCSEAMTSVFARRLGAIRQIMPSENNIENDDQKMPRYDIVSAQNTAPLSEIFHAIQNLRLSRDDILRWMNSDVSLSRLNGFFLRLRLRKMDQGLEGDSYCVACISAGNDRERTGCTSSKSILVDVGGIKSCISSQCVSNHDFLEEEIKAWWFGAVDRACSVPSIDELNSKFNNRTSLGF